MQENVTSIIFPFLASTLVLIRPLQVVAKNPLANLTLLLALQGPWILSHQTSISAVLRSAGVGTALFALSRGIGIAAISPGASGALVVAKDVLTLILLLTLEDLALFWCFRLVNRYYKALTEIPSGKSAVSILPPVVSNVEFSVQVVAAFAAVLLTCATQHIVLAWLILRVAESVEVWKEEKGESYLLGVSTLVPVLCAKFHRGLGASWLLIGAFSSLEILLLLVHLQYPVFKVPYNFFMPLLGMNAFSVIVEKQSVPSILHFSVALGIAVFSRFLLISLLHKVQST